MILISEAHCTFIIRFRCESYSDSVISNNVGFQKTIRARKYHLFISELDNFSRFLLLMARLILPVAYIALFLSTAVLMPTRLRCTAFGLVICCYDIGRLFTIGVQAAVSIRARQSETALCQSRPIKIR